MIQHTVSCFKRGIKLISEQTKPKPQQKCSDRTWIELKNDVKHNPSHTDSEKSNTTTFATNNEATAFHQRPERGSTGIALAALDASVASAAAVAAAAFGGDVVVVAADAAAAVGDPLSEFC
jgi:hypothetical protein